MELIRQGAEAKLYKTMFQGKEAILKTREPKAYRCKELDETLRATRTTKETNLLRKARSLGIKTPLVYDSDKKKKELVMELVDGPRLKDILDEKHVGLCKKVGEAIAKMHSNNMVHGDLTTSNILIKGNELYFIDFGLGKTTTKTEDKAVDLLVFRKTFEATHVELMPKGWETIIKSYMEKGGKQAVLDQMRKVEDRVRYH